MIRATRFTRAIIALHIFLLVNMVVPQTPAQPVQNSAADAAGQGTLFLKLVSSRTGLAVTPGLISIDGQPILPSAAEGGLVMLSLPNGTHEIRAEVDGFAPMETSVSVNGNNSPVVELELDPATAPEDPQPAADEAVLYGTVSDADSAQPVAGAQLGIIDSLLDAKTTASGEFRFLIKPGKASMGQQPAVSLEARADGFQTVRLKNIPLTPGSAVRIPVRLERSTSATAQQDIAEIDQWTRPGGEFLNDWVFDVTLR